jgi:hypothetical protein
MDTHDPFVLRQRLSPLVAPTILACSMGAITAQRLGLDAWSGRCALALALFPILVWAAALLRPAVRLSGSTLTLVRVPLLPARVLRLPEEGTWSYDGSRNRLELPTVEGATWSGYFALAPEDAARLDGALRSRGILRRSVS